jgi:hypothetical protein
MALLEMAFEAGLVAGVCARRHPTWTFRRAVFSDGRPAQGLWTSGSGRAWAWCLASLLCALAWIAIRR